MLSWPVASLSSSSWPLTVDVQVNGAMADHQPQTLGWAEGGKGEGLLREGGGAWGPNRGGNRGGRQGCSHAAQIHAHHVRQPITPGPVPVLLRGPVGSGGWAQGHQGFCAQAAARATASPLVQGDAGCTEDRERRGPPGLGASAPPGARPELGLRQPLEPEGRGVRASAAGQGAQGLAGSCGGPGEGERHEGLVSRASGRVPRGRRAGRGRAGGQQTRGWAWGGSPQNGSRCSGDRWAQALGPRGPCRRLRSGPCCSLRLVSRSSYLSRGRGGKGSLGRRRKAPSPFLVGVGGDGSRS